MLIRRFTLSFLIVGSTCSVVFPSVTFTPTTPILTILNDTSNLVSSNTNYAADFYTDEDVYLNSVTLIPGAGYDNNIGLSAPFNGLDYSDYNGSSGTYDLGNLLPAGTDYSFQDLATGAGASPFAAVGTYNFTVQIAGGDSPVSTDVLADIPYQVEVLDKLNVGVVATATPSTISPGETTTINITATNNMTGHSFMITSLYYVNNGMEDGLGDSLSNGQFGTNWAQTIDPGDSATFTHSTWDATAATPNGTYVGRLGLIGGLYSGDDFEIPGSPSVVVVPEPATALIAGFMAIAAIGVRRRRNCIARA